MTPGARLAAAIECLDAIAAGAPAERVLTTWARRARFAGSKDRAAIRDQVFDVLRARESCAILGEGTSGRALILGLCALQGQDAGALFGGGIYDPPALSDPERATWQTRDTRLEGARSAWNMPDAARTALAVSHGDSALDIAIALASRAPIDLRVNLRKSTRDDAVQLLADDGIIAAPVEISGTALRVTEGARKIRNSASYLNGVVELQDAGSQALVDHVLAWRSGTPPERILDYCAGGGGKSLGLAAQTGARIVAHDINAARMTDLPVRAKRAGAQIICAGTPDLSQYGPYDVILCDAPCSGSGSWRRAPDAKWRFDDKSLRELVTLQLSVLEQALPHLAEGGALVYATCSLFDAENDGVTHAFLNAHPEFTVKRRFSVTPLDGCDGFFLTLLVMA